MVLAVPAVAVLVVAFVALALHFFRPVGLQSTVDQFLRGIPIVGQQIGDAAAAIGRAVSDWAASWINPLVQPLVDLFDFLVGWAVAIVAAGTAAATWLTTTISTIVALGYSRFGLLLAQLAAVSLGLAAAVSRLAALALRVASQAAQLASIVTVVIPNAIGRAVAIVQAWTLGQLGALRAALQAAIYALESRVLALLGAEAASRAAGDAAGRALAHAEAASVAASAAAALAAERALTGVQLGELDHAIAGIEAKVGEWAVPATIAATIATTITEVGRIARCNDPMCSYLSPQLGALELVADAATIALIAELVHAAAHDPEGAARDTIATTAGIVGGTVGLFAELAGITL